jgi:hypothetical protein
MKIRIFWKIYHANKIFLEHLPFKGNISMEKDTNPTGQPIDFRFRIME